MIGLVESSGSVARFIRHLIHHLLSLAHIPAPNCRQIFCIPLFFADHKAWDDLLRHYQPRRIDRLHQQALRFRLKAQRIQHRLPNAAQEPR